MILKQYILSAFLLKMSERIILYVQPNTQFLWIFIFFITLAANHEKETDSGFFILNRRKQALRTCECKETGEKKIITIKKDRVEGKEKGLQEGSLATHNVAR